MEYNYKEYKPVMDTPTKRLEEKAIIERIMLLLNENKKFASLESFYNQNSTINDFKKNNNMDVVLKHFDQKITQEDYVKIIDNLKKLTKQKMSFDTENIKTTNIENKEYVTYNNENEKFYLNNSYSSDSIEDQMKNLQQENNDFQTADIKENTNRLMKEMQKNKKMSLILRYLNEINYEVLNKEQQELFKFVFDYQKKSNGLLRVDLDEKILVDNEDNIIKIEKIDGNFKTINSNEKYSSQEPINEEKMEKIESNNQLSIKKLPKVQLFSEGE